jgi:hypothetical protein
MNSGSPLDDPQSFCRASPRSAYIDNDELDILIAEGVGLMRAFKDALQNKVYTAFVAASNFL